MQIETILNTGEVKRVFLRTPYNYDMDEVSDETGLRCEDESKAQQHFKDECDINVIVERFGLTGALPDNLRMPTNEEFWEVKNFQEALNVINSARESFMELPAEVRAEFDNDPGRFMDFVSDDTNREKAKKLGIVVDKPKPLEPAPVRVQVITPEPDKTA